MAVPNDDDEQQRREIQAQIERLQAKLAIIGEKREQPNTKPSELPLSLPEYRRYGRQMILEEFGLQAQLKLKSARLLVIGAGGLGCPAMLYLASAGVGHITVVDHDTVEISNLHRQVLHTEDTISLPKVESAKRAALARNSGIEILAIQSALTPSLLTSPQLNFKSYDLVLDCSDNAATRYLLSDACVAFDKTLVSGAAIRAEGQVSVWNLPSPQNAETKERGPCLRCVFPLIGDGVDNATSQNCEDEGVLGTVTGIIGLQMASEAIKLMIGRHDLVPSLLLYHPFGSPQFRQMKIKGRKSACVACRDEGASQLMLQHKIKDDQGAWQIATCGFGENVPLSHTRISAKALSDVMNHTKVIDVRPAHEFSICSIPGSENIPLKKLQRGERQVNGPVAVVCRRGNDSVQAVKHLRTQGISAVDVAGGLRSWAAQVDTTFPVY